MYVCIYVYYIYTVYVSFVGPEPLTHTQTKSTWIPESSHVCYVGSHVDRYLPKPSPNGFFRGQDVLHGFARRWSSETV